MSPQTRLAVFLAAWVIWLLPVVIRQARAGRRRSAALDRRARWGMALEMAAYSVACTHTPRVWNSGIETWRAVAGFLCFAIGCALFWSAMRYLGKQWRVDAGLYEDHALVQSGTYRLVRHPVYASMLWMLLMSIFWVGTLPGWPIALVLFLAGTEIRVRTEDRLLRERFGAKFTAWQKSVPAYLPFVR